MDQFCAACTSLPITQTTTMMREEKAKMASQLLSDGGTKPSSENPKTAASIRMESSSAIVNANEKTLSQGPETQIPSHPLEGHTAQGSQVQRTMDQNQHNSNSNLNEQQQQQQQQQQFQHPQPQPQQHRWSNDLVGEPLSRRHSVDGSPRDREYTSPQVNERSGFGGQGPGSVPSDVICKDGNNLCDGAHNNTQSMNESGRNQNQNMNMNQSNQAQRPSMASSLLAEGISRMMDFLSKSPSQKSSMINPDRSPSTSSKNQNQNSSQVPSPYGMRNRASSYSDAENRSRTSQPQGNGFEGLDSSRQISLNQNQNQNSGHASGSSQMINQTSNLSQRRNGIYQNQNQNNVSNEEQRRARMSSVFEEKEIPKGMRLSGSDDGFVLVEPTPLPAPPHPWRGTVSFNTAAKNNHSTSGKVNSANARDTGINGAGTTQSVTDGSAVREQYESSSQKHQQNQSQNQIQNQRTEQFQSHQQQQQQQQQQQVSPTQYLPQQEQDQRQGQILGQGQAQGLGQSSYTNHHQSPYQQQQQQQPSLQDQHLRLSSLKEKSPSPSAIENEKFMIAELTQRTEFVCQVVLSIVSVGDGMAKDILQQERKNQNSFAGKFLRTCDVQYLQSNIIFLSNCFPS
jgi:hypothetical protein